MELIFCFIGKLFLIQEKEREKERQIPEVVSFRWRLQRTGEQKRPLKFCSGPHKINITPENIKIFETVKKVGVVATKMTHNNRFLRRLKPIFMSGVYQKLLTLA